MVVQNGTIPPLRRAKQESGKIVSLGEKHHASVAIVTHTGARYLDRQISRPGGLRLCDGEPTRLIVIIELIGPPVGRERNWATISEHIDAQPVRNLIKIVN